MAGNKDKHQQRILDDFLSRSKFVGPGGTEDVRAMFDQAFGDLMTDSDLLLIVNTQNSFDEIRQNYYGMEGVSRERSLAIQVTHGLAATEAVATIYGRWRKKKAGTDVLMGLLDYMAPGWLVGEVNPRWVEAMADSMDLEPAGLIKRYFGMGWQGEKDGAISRFSSINLLQNLYRLKRGQKESLSVEEYAVVSATLTDRMINEFWQQKTGQVHELLVTPIADIVIHSTGTLLEAMEVELKEAPLPTYVAHGEEARNFRDWVVWCLHEVSLHTVRELGVLGGTTSRQFLAAWLMADSAGVQEYAQVAAWRAWQAHYQGKLSLPLWILSVGRAEKQMEEDREVRGVQERLRQTMRLRPVAGDEAELFRRMYHISAAIVHDQGDASLLFTEGVQEIFSRIETDQPMIYAEELASLVAAWKQVSGGWPLRLEIIDDKSEIVVTAHDHPQAVSLTVGLVDKAGRLRLPVSVMVKLGSEFGNDFDKRVMIEVIDQEKVDQAMRVGAVSLVEALIAREVARRYRERAAELLQQPKVEAEVELPAMVDEPSEEEIEPWVPMVDEAMTKLPKVEQTVKLRKAIVKELERYVTVRRHDAAKFRGLPERTLGENCTEGWEVLLGQNILTFKMNGSELVEVRIDPIGKVRW